MPLGHIVILIMSFGFEHVINAWELTETQNYDDNDLVKYNKQDFVSISMKYSKLRHIDE